MADIQKFDPDQQQGTSLLLRERPKLQKPRKYRVVLLNDDFTPMEFVVWLLMNVFHMQNAEATRLMLTIHKTGRGVCGVYTHDIARTKCYQVQRLAEENGHPLQSVMEAVEPEHSEGE